MSLRQVSIALPSRDHGNKKNHLSNCKHVQKANLIKSCRGSGSFSKIRILNPWSAPSNMTRACCAYSRTRYLHARHALWIQAQLSNARASWPAYNAARRLA